MVIESFSARNRLVCINCTHVQSAPRPITNDPEMMNQLPCEECEQPTMVHEDEDLLNLLGIVKDSYTSQGWTYRFVIVDS